MPRLSVTCDLSQLANDHKVCFHEKLTNSRNGGGRSLEDLQFHQGTLCFLLNSFLACVLLDTKLMILWNLRGHLRRVLRELEKGASQLNQNVRALCLHGFPGRCLCIYKFLGTVIFVLGLGGGSVHGMSCNQAARVLASVLHITS